MALNLAGLGAFLGGNQGQGGIVNPLQQLVQQQKQQQQQAFALQALRQALTQNNGMGATPYPPPGINAPPQIAAQAVPPAGINGVPPQAVGKPQIAPIPSGPPAPSPGVIDAPPGEGASMTPQAPATSTPPVPAAGAPNIQARQEQMMAKILDSDAPPEAKIQALEMVGAFLSPVEKLQAQLDAKMAQLQSQQTLAEAKIQELRDIEALRAGTKLDVANIQQQGANQRTGAVNETKVEVANIGANTKRFVAAKQAETADKKFEIYATEHSKDREEKAREADQKSKDAELSIDERAQAAALAAQYRAAALHEKSLEAAQKSQDTRYGIDERAQFHKDAMELRQGYLQEKTNMDAAKQKDMLVKEQQAVTNEQGRNARAAEAQVGATQRTGMQQQGANTRTVMAGGKPPPLVKTQAEYDKLPSGVVYQEEDGNFYTKP